MNDTPYEPKRDGEPLFPLEEMNVMTEMTGLIPAGIETQEEGENYEHMYPFLPGHEHKSGWLSS